MRSEPGVCVRLIFYSPHEKQFYSFLDIQSQNTHYYILRQNLWTYCTLLLKNVVYLQSHNKPIKPKFKTKNYERKTSIHADIARSIYNRH